MDITRDIQPVTTFRNHSAQIMRHLKETKRPVILTVNGKPVAVIQDAEAYQRLLDIAAQADTAEGIRQGLDHIAKRKSHLVKEMVEAIRAEYDAPP